MSTRHAGAPELSEEQTLALMSYMLEHNRSHAEELHNIAHALENQGRHEAAEPRRRRGALLRPLQRQAGGGPPSGERGVNNMCLSDAFELVGGERRPLMHYVSGISVEDGKVTLTDMLGARKVVPGTLKSVDLTDNIILIEPAEMAQ